MDKILLCKILETPTSTPTPALYLELGLVPLSFKIKAKRIIYLYEILKRNDSEMLKKVFEAQSNDPVKGDWTETVKKDLIDFDLNHLSFDSIKMMKKGKFKKLVKKKCKEKSFEYLSSDKKERMVQNPRPVSQ